MRSPGAAPANVTRPRWPCMRPPPRTSLRPIPSPRKALYTPRPLTPRSPSGGMPVLAIDLVESVTYKAGPVSGVGRRIAARSPDRSHARREVTTLEHRAANRTRGRLVLIECPRSPSGGIGRRSGLRQNNLSPRGEIHEVKPVKVGEGPEHSCSS
jgi:hypothetical protein